VLSFVADSRDGRCAGSCRDRFGLLGNFAHEREEMGDWIGYAYNRKEMRERTERAANWMFGARAEL